ncbi:mechanosensitive ion channel [Guyparkeria hydrothermalis]|uniref:mechanosensitive ion channel domain-containing protein n=1 Tax=Guyparkeria TaxID=2035712 RepID=UPI0010ABCBD2|nr:mechanosensitive ion channel domain-containing protein [Guyparkeria sp. SB14A]MCL7750935.1 mechanosensitive ion channel [Guyparkeria hydrothermalis]TKA90599.1 mechanosensitive ion channel [Guyparkeria sp. SB14A]
MSAWLSTRLSTWRALVVSLLLIVAGPALAQQAGGQAGAAASDGTASADSSSDSSAEGPYAGLLELLKDPAKRDELIAELERLSAGEGESSNDGAASDAEQAADASGIADGIASGLVGVVSSTVADMAGAGSRLVKGGVDVDWVAVGQIAWRVLAALVIAYLVLAIGRRLLGGVWRRLDAYARSANSRHRLFRTGVAVLASLALGVVLLAIAYVAAQASVWWLADGDKTTGAVLGLALQAFVVVEAARLLIGTAFAPASPGLRLFRLSEDDSRFWSGWLSRVIWFTGYAGILLVPAIELAERDDLASAVGWGVAVLALAYTWSRLWKARGMVGGALLTRAERSRQPVASWAFRLLAVSWHWLAMIYATGVFVVAITRPGESLPFVALATFNTAIIVGASIFIAAMLTQWIGRGVRVPERWLHRMPTLQLRLNTYVPLILRIVRVVIGIVALFGVLSVWNLVDMFAWLASDSGRWMLAAVIDISIVLIIALMVWLVATGLIEAKLNSDAGMPSARLQTLLSLFRNAIAIALITITAMIILSELGVNIGPLLAGAGVLGLAIGFGAQKMVQDVITGVFIQIENAINTGDVITAAGVTGTAERLSIRSVSLRDLSGTVHVIPFSSVDIVSNYMREYAYHKGEYGIAYRENIDDAIAQLKAAFDELAADPDWKDHILEPVEIPGVTALADSSVNIRVMIKTTPGDQWAVGRAYNRLVKMYFDKAGIEIPFPHTTLYFGVDKDGTSPPANVHLLKDERVAEDYETESERNSRRGQKPDGPGGKVPAQDDVETPED